jgi:hypothetical protein
VAQATCAICSANFYVRPSELEAGHGRFCSKPCKGVAQRGTKPTNMKHGLTGTPAWKSWDAMLQRCTNPRSKDWPRYGGRGIGVSPAWMSFEQFLADMGPRPDGHSLGRIDNDGPYTAANCRWETDAQQNNNRRSSRLIEHEGRSQTVAQWAREIGCSRQALRYRLESGWSVAQAISTGVSHANRRT